ncbi:MAG: 23S rRNA (guanosine(2251)-2'-O)-methyltransferase RlmB, partial [Spirochaetales bacterium]
LRSFKKAKTPRNDIEIRFNKPGPRVKKLIAFAEELQIPCIQCSPDDLDNLVSGLNKSSHDHRGIVLVYKEDAQKRKGNIVRFDSYLVDLLQKNNSEKPITVVLLDHITDPHNIGAVIRSCDQFGASLLVIPEHGSGFESDVIARSSAGAVSWIPVAIVSNLVRTIEKLQKAGFWTYAAQAGGTSVHEIDIPSHFAVVLGSEGSGISRLLAETCDASLSIPTCGKLDSLNVSVAAGIILYEVHKQILCKGNISKN